MKSFREKLLAIAIAIVFVFFVGYGISTFVKEPQYEDYCDEMKVAYTEEECAAAEGRWNPNGGPRLVKEENYTGWCEIDYTCRKVYEEDRKAYESIISLVALVAGTLAIILAGSFIKVGSIAAGIMGGGLLAIVYGIIRYWRYMEDVFRFVTLGCILALLVWFGYKKFKK